MYFLDSLPVHFVVFILFWMCFFSFHLICNYASGAHNWLISYSIDQTHNTHLCCTLNILPFQFSWMFRWVRTCLTTIKTILSPILRQICFFQILIEQYTNVDRINRCVTSYKSEYRRFTRENKKKQLLKFLDNMNKFYIWSVHWNYNFFHFNWILLCEYLKIFRSLEAQVLWFFF